jgi:hypothetical protein
MVDYLAPFWELFRHDSRLRFRLLLLFPSEGGGEEYRHVAQKLPVRQIEMGMPSSSATAPDIAGGRHAGGLRGARLRPWDLVVYADHGDPGFLLRSPSVYIGHGPKCKTYDGTEYAYSSHSFDRSGHRLYSLMFAETEAEKTKVVTEDPGLKEIVTVVGNLESDAVLAQLPRRSEFRVQFGFQPGEIVVLVLSTWRDHCLWRTMGDALLEEIRKCKSDFRFVLSAHPHEYRKQPGGGRVWGEYLRSQRQHGLIVREPSESWIPYMVASDIVVSDFTGLIEYAVLLERRIVLTPVPEAQIWQDSVVAKVRGFAPILDDARFLRDRLMEAQANYPMEQLRQLARLVHPYPGEAAGRIRQAIYRALDLAPLEAARADARCFVECRSCLRVRSFCYFALGDL